MGRKKNLGFSHIYFLTRDRAENIKDFFDSLATSFVSFGKDDEIIGKEQMGESRTIS